MPINIASAVQKAAWPTVAVNIGRQMRQCWSNIGPMSICYLGEWSQIARSWRCFKKYFTQQIPTWNEQRFKSKVFDYTVKYRPRWNHDNCQCFVVPSKHGKKWKSWGFKWNKVNHESVNTSLLWITPCRREKLWQDVVLSNMRDITVTG